MASAAHRLLEYCFLLLLLGFLSTGCATLPEDYPRANSTAFQHYLDTSVGQLFEEVAVQHPGESGFAMIRHGRTAFTARIALTALAEKSLDVQYYIWEADATGRILADRLIEAADRGVRVRVLVDDINLAGRDAIVASMDAHPNIEIRIFNPFANRDTRMFDFLIDLNRINHRMHNKLMIMDNAVAIVGGRNIGDHYFGVATDANFRDLDIAAAGPVVRGQDGEGGVEGLVAEGELHGRGAQRRGGPRGALADHRQRRLHPVDPPGAGPHRSHTEAGRRATPQPCGPGPAERV